MDNHQFDEMVCAKCSSDHISINMFFNVWNSSWGTLADGYWCHECNSGDYGFCHIDDYQEEE